MHLGTSLCTTTAVFQEFRLESIDESVYENLCPWQWVERGNVDFFVLLFGRTVVSLGGRKLCHIIPLFPLYPEAEGKDRYSIGEFEYGPWACGINCLAAVKCWEAHLQSQGKKKKKYNRRVTSNLTSF